MTTPDTRAALDAALAAVVEHARRWPAVGEDHGPALRALAAAYDAHLADDQARQAAEESEIQRLRRVNGEWGLVMSTLIDGLAERDVPTPLGGRYTQAALDEIDRLRAELAQALRERDDRSAVLKDVIAQRDQAYAARDHNRRLGNQYADAYNALRAVAKSVADELSQRPPVAAVFAAGRLRAALDSTGEVSG